MMRASLCAVGIAAVTFGLSAVVAADRQPGNASPVFGVTLPKGFRNWKLISVAQENGKNNDIRAILGNDIAVEAFRKNRRPFPDGAMIVRLAWRYTSSLRNDTVFPSPQSFVAGKPTNIQVSVKDSKRYASTRGWGYGQFENGVSNHDPAVIKACFACHVKLEKLDSGADFVFSGYSK
ncbi:cytochrome P460 family protein [Sphingomonas sp. PAMC 26605]|uniref:cytochrome P460 family protein n=1 Tax=Sphingomonas sp. PAMC 26605 TaxID=1112214 RepID=UPI00026CB1CC|nr:cytochrome P460 family protein [Sphingomonas sp. PAMC 26605]